MYRFIFLLLFALTISNSIYSTVLKGRVSDSQTGEELVGATIYIKELKSGTISGLDGSFLFKNVPKGSYTVSTSYIG